MLETRRGVGILINDSHRTSGFMDIIRGTKNECQVSIQITIKIQHLLLVIYIVFDQLLTN